MPVLDPKNNTRPIDAKSIDFIGTQYSDVNISRAVTNSVVGVPQEDIGKSYRPTKSKVSDPSISIDEVNVPEIKDLSTNFTYNYYLTDERIASPQITNLPLSRVPRYVSLGWTSPFNSEVKETRTFTNQTEYDLFSIEKNANKIVSEDNFFNPDYINHTFSNISAIEQGTSDLENYSRMSKHDAESMFDMSKYQIQEIASNGDVSDKKFEKNIKELSSVYEKLSDSPKTALGLRVYDEKGNLNDDDGLLRSITKSLTLSIKVNSLVIPDIFKDSVEKNDANNLQNFKVSSANARGRTNRDSGQVIESIQNECSKLSANSLTQPVVLLGYIIDRYVSSESGYVKDKTFYIEDVLKTQFVDRTPLYGRTYVYSVRVVASVKIMTYDSSGSIVDLSTIYVSSRPTTSVVECYEYTPPPEPNDIKFVFDYNDRNLRIYWDTPVNPQKDIKQFQVFRRKNIKEPFELIAQYGFDTSKYGPGESRYKTGERVDANNIDKMISEDKSLVYAQDSKSDASRAVYMHIDNDFTVDTEFFVSSNYIYALCSVDAHGIISNYSSQHHVSFDPYKNRLVTKVVCDSGSPKQYPNMTLRTDAFKDVIRISGTNTKQLKVYFTPEYLKVRDESGKTYKVVEAQNVNNNPYYLLQLINLDNQKLQTIKINIKDPENLTV